MLTEPPVSEGDLGRQLLAAINPNSATNSIVALIAVDDIVPIMRKQLLVEPAKRSSPINSSFLGPELAIASITYFENLRNRSAFAGVLAMVRKCFVTTMPSSDEIDMVTACDLDLGIRSP
jgi:hypothetical protein